MKQLKPLIIEECGEFTPEQIEYFTKLWIEHQASFRFNPSMFLTGTGDTKEYKWNIEDETKSK
jgi:hypothetical protein